MWACRSFLDCEEPLVTRDASIFPVDESDLVGTWLDEFDML
jgi:hypothetical protein